MAKPPMSTTLADLAKFGSGPLDMGTSVSAAKRQQVQMSSIAKQAMYGDPDTQQIIATADRDGNRMAQDPDLQALQDMSPIEAARAFGFEAAMDRYRYSEARRRLDQLEGSEMSDADAVRDTALSFGKGLANLAATPVTLATQAVDSVYGSELAPNWSRMMGRANEFAEGLRSEDGQARVRQHQIEGMLAEEDAQLEYDEAVTANGGEESLAMQAGKIGRDAMNAVKNYADDPYMATQATAEGIGSLVPITASVRAIGGTMALNKAMARGMSRKEASDFLKTAEGRKMINEESMNAVPMVTAISEGGSSISQAQQEILAMSHEELLESEQYRTLINAGNSPEQARMELAKQAGNVAGLSGGLIGLLTGRIGRSFEANPMGVANGGFGKAAGSAIRETGKETIEEGLQEGGNQLSSNAAVQSIGMDRDLTEGVGTAIGEGMVGGLGTGAVLQTPGAVAGTAVETGRAAASGASRAFDARMEGIEETLDAESAVGTPARAKAAEVLDQGLKTLTAPSQDVDLDEDARAELDRAGYMPADEEQDFIDNFEQLAAEKEETGRIRRSSVMDVVGQMVTSKEVPEEAKAGAAISLLESYDLIQRMDSSEVRDKIASLPEDHPKRTEHAKVVEELATLVNSPAVKAAKERLSAMTREEVVETFGLNGTEIDETTAKALATVARYNPMVINVEDVDKVLEQAKGLSDNPILRKRMAEVRAMAAEFQEATETIEEIAKEKARAQGEQRGPIERDRVREDIMTRNNRQNDMKSILGHRTAFSEAIAAGNFEAAFDALGELQSFATSQANKIEAYNESARSGKGERIPFQAYGPYGFFLQDEKPVYVNLKSNNSIETARQARVDSQLVAGLYNSLIETYGDELGDRALERVEIPQLDPSIRFNGQTAQPSPAPETQTEQAQEAPAREKPEDDVELIDREDRGEEQVTPERTEAEPAKSVEETVEEDDGDIELIDRDDTGEAEPEAGSQEEETAEVEVEEAPALSSLEEAIGKDLVKPAKGENVFLKAFRLREDGSQLLAHTDPLAHAVQRQPEIAPSVLNKIIEASNTISSRLQEVFAGQAEKLNWVDALEKGLRNPMEWKNAFPLNFLREDGDLDPRVVQASIMAMVEWMAKDAAQGHRAIDRERAAKLLQMRNEAEVTSEHMDLLLKGPMMQSAIDDIAKRFEALLGVSPVSTELTNYTQGIPRAMAANMLEQAEQLGWLTINRDKTPEGKALYTITRSEEGTGAEIIEGLARQPQPFTEVFVPNFEKTRYVGEAPTTRPDSRIRQKTSRLSKLEKQVVSRLQKIEYRLNPSMVTLADALGDELFLKLLGHKELDEKTTNVNQVMQQRSRNKALARGLAGVRDYMADAVAIQGDGSVMEVPIYFDWMISSVGRLQQQGPVTPQGDKIVREMISATRSTLDLDNEDHERALWLAVAQSLDISIEKKNPDDVMVEVGTMLRDSLRPAVNALRTLIQTGEIGDPGAFLETIEQGGLEVTPKAIHALMTVAEFEEHLAYGGGSFQTSLALEFDGKTDGPINAMINMGYGPFTADQVSVMAKGGLFFGDMPLSLNSYIAGDAELGWQGDKVDLYETTAADFENRLADAMQDAEDPELIRRVLDLLSLFTSDVEAVTEGVEIKRGFVKNPLTVFLYGSGEKGIAQKVAGQIQDGLYALMSDIASSPDIKSWDQHPLFVEHEGLRKDLVETFGEKIEQMLANPVEATFSPKQINFLTSQIQRAIMEPMMEAIDANTGGLRDAMQTIQAASQIQALFYRDTYNALLEAYKEKNGLSKSQIPSKKALEELMAEASKVAPIYASDAQEFHISTQDKFSSDIRISETLSGELSSGATIPMPSDAGVKVSPYLVIGTGDGKMMLNIYADADARLDTTLPVFDGVESALTDIRGASEQVNAAVWKGWKQESVAEMVNEGFTQFMRSVDPEVMSAETRQEMKRILKSQGLDSLTAAQGMSEMGRRLQKLSAENRARKAAMSRMKARIDHMAGAEGVHESDGVSVPMAGTYDVAAIEEQLNTFYEEELQKLRDEAKDARKRPEIQPANEALSALIEEVGMPTSVEGVTMVEGKALARFAAGRNGFSRDQVKLFWDMLKDDPLFEDQRFYFGKAKDLETLRNQEYPSLPRKPIQNAQAFSKTPVMFIANASPETILHEVLHGYTGQRLEAHYADPESSPAYVRDAVARLETLMADFRQMEFTSRMGNTALDRAALILQGELARLEKDPAVQMSEFLSWTLTNQELIGLTQKVRAHSPLLAIAGKVLKALKDMLGLKTSPGVTMFSQIRFNTEVLIREPNKDRLAEVDARTQSIFEQAHGRDPRLDRIEKRFMDRLERYLAKTSEGSKKRENAARADLFARSRNAAEMAQAAGIPMTDREVLAFQAVHATMASGMEMNPAAMRRTNRLFSHVLRNLDQLGKPELEFLTTQRATAKNRSDLLATFVALGLVHEPFREVLSKLQAPSAADGEQAGGPEGKIDTLLRRVANGIIDRLTRLSISRRSLGATTRDQLDTLGEVLSEIKQERRDTAEARVNGVVDRANAYLSQKLQAGSEALSEDLARRRQASGNRYARVGFGAAAIVTALGSSDASEKAGDSLTKLLNNTPRANELRALVNDIRGFHKSNESLMRLMNQVKSKVDAMRQDYREKIPVELEKRFTRKLDREEWRTLYKGLARTDLTSLGREEAFTLVQDLTRLPVEIRKAEAEVRKLGGQKAPRYVSKARALGHYMTTGEVISNDLLRNAFAIVKIAGREKDPDPAMVEAVDRLTTLYAIDKLDKAEKETLQSLAESEEEGLRFVLGYQASTRGMELNRIPPGKDGDRARMNGWKGFAPSVIREGHSLIVADDVEGKELAMKGYVRVGTYHGDGREGGNLKRGYYRSSVGGQAAFRQGIAQTVHATWQGIDPGTGMTRTGEFAGAVLGKKATRISQSGGRGNDKLPPAEYLVPLYGADGVLYGYERPLSAEMKATVERDENLARMLGVWSGRMLEEEQADLFNRKLVEELKAIHDKEGGKGGTEFVNVADEGLDDPIARDAWNTLGSRIKKDAAEVFGKEDFLPVRRDMLSDALGYHAASVRDNWTGTTRWSPEAQRAVRTAAMAVMGKNAYRNMVAAEGFVQDAVSYAKTTIVVRSVTVMWQNLVSNGLHLMSWGIGPVALVKGNRDKFIEVSQFTKNQERILSLNAELAAVVGNQAKTRRLRAEIQALEDANAGMSIAPLIEAGEFSTVSESLTEADQAIREGKLSDYLERAAEKLPGLGKEAAKNLLITKDTALFQGLNRAVQYGDFVAKAVLYGHLTETKGRSKEEALRVIAEEFVPYNRLAGRGRDYVESMGLLWFYNYKLRIMKIMANMIRERPVSALFYAGGVGPAADIDTVVSGSGIGAYLDDRLGYSIGPAMGMNAWTLNPWLNMVR